MKTPVATSATLVSALRPSFSFPFPSFVFTNGNAHGYLQLSIQNQTREHVNAFTRRYVTESTLSDAVPDVCPTPFRVFLLRCARRIIYEPHSVNSFAPLKSKDSKTRGNPDGIDERLIPDSTLPGLCVLRRRIRRKNCLHTVVIAAAALIGFYHYWTRISTTVRQPIRLYCLRVTNECRTNNAYLSKENTRWKYNQKALAELTVPQ